MATMTDDEHKGSTGAGAGAGAGAGEADALSPVSVTFDPIHQVYTRVWAEKVLRAQMDVLRLYPAELHVEGASFFPSGMAAIYTTLDAWILDLITAGTKPVRILAASEMYCDTWGRVLPRLAAVYGDRVALHKYDVTVAGALLEAAATSQPHVLLLESVSNPSGYTIDWSQLNRLPAHTRVVVDNTWMTPLLFNCFKSPRVDAVLESTSKYLSLGKCIGGVGVYRRYFKPVNQTVCTEGLHFAHHYCDLVRAAVAKLPSAVAVMQSRTTQVLAWLTEEAKDVVDCVMHPSLASHPTHKRFAAMASAGATPAVIWFHVNRTVPGKKAKKAKQEALGTLLGAAGIPFETSFGKSYSLIDQWPKWDDKGVWLRLSIGFGDADDAASITTRLAKLFAGFIAIAN